MKKNFRVIIINLIIFTILLKILDLIVFSKLEVSYISDSHKLNIRTYKENLYETYEDATKQKKINLITDSNGFIAEQEKETTNKNEIFFLGGSTTANIGIESKYRFPYLFGKKIDSLDFKIYNSGVGGNHSFHSNLILLSKILSRNPRPKYIFLHHNVNDISQLIRTQSYWSDYNERGIIQFENQRRFSNPILNFLFNVKELIIPNLWKKLSPIINRSSIKIKNNIDLANDKIDKEMIMDEFKKSIVLFIKICEIYQIEPILITQYSRYKLDEIDIIAVHSKNMKRYELICELHPRFNEILRDISYEMNVKLIDLANLIPNNKEYLYDEVHLNKKGNILASEIISDFFVNNFVIMN